ncbi:protein-L-isoaspartate O-methyltransferase [Candidatus Marinamargulisbacteria bacterium SCGC AG-410-N11]|nr:protein-L-isoaspartate O-methyltransferase [Candidatus Marinamargulisbacteria bacterium SCGC AG-410-N11]
MEQYDWNQQAKDMVYYQLKGRDITDEKVMSVMQSIPRHDFVAEPFKDRAYQDYPLAINCNQTISQPYIVALMTQLLNLQSSHKVLEIGTGSGYQTAVLASLSQHVYSVELLKELHELAKERLLKLNYKHIQFLCDDGYCGWRDNAPYDRIIVTAAMDEEPTILLDQLAIGGCMIVPIGVYDQTLMKYLKIKEDFIKKESIIPVRFVPLVHS